jgi:hypothetical protein
VVAGQELDRSVADAVAARVTDVADVHPALARAEHGADDRGAHPVVLAGASAPLEDLAVRHPDAGEQPIFLFRQVGVEVERPRHVFIRGRAEELRDRLCSDLGSHVPSAVPAHSVGNDVKVVLLEHDEGIFVVLSLEPHVAQPGRDCPHQRAPFSQREKTFIRQR